MDQWGNEKVLEFIELYQGESLLWDPQHKLHKNRNAAIDAWGRIKNVFSLNVTVGDLKKKKESLMTTYRYHLQKKKESIRSGAGADEIYETNWFAFTAMDAFLSARYEVMPTRDSENSNEETELFNDQTSEPSNFVRPDSPAIQNRAGVSQRRRNQDSNSEESRKQMKEAFGMLKSIADRNTRPQHEEDECDLYGKLLAKKLKKFPEPKRQLIMYEIDGLLIRQASSSQEASGSTTGTFPMYVRHTQSPQNLNSPTEIHIPEISMVEGDSSLLRITPSKPNPLNVSHPRTNKPATRPQYQSLEPVYIVSQEIVVPASTSSETP